jgi:excinuclease UvrABC ATPase subunit
MTTDAPAPALHAADRHDLIRVGGAGRTTSRTSASTCPKRRLTVFTGVSGSGKSSLVFGTIAAESQRLINETYSAFLQGFMPNVARPDVDLLEGLTTAIIVDQERMGANPALHGRAPATDVNAMLRIVFSRLGQPHIGSSQAFSFNVASISGAGAVTIEKAGTTVKERRSFTITGGHVPALRGHGARRRHRHRELVDESKSLMEGAITVPGYTPDGWFGRIFGAVVPLDVPVAQFTEQQRHEFLYGEARKIKVEGINLTYEGLVPKIQKSMLSKDVDSLQPHVRAFVQRAVTFTACPDCGGTRLNEGAAVVEDQGDQHRRRVRHADQRPGRLGARAGRAVGGAAAGGPVRHPRLVRRDRPRLPQPRPVDRHAVRRGVAAHQDDPPPRLVAHRRDVRLRRADDRLHPHDIQRMNGLLLQLRDKGNTVLGRGAQAETIVIADHVVDLGPASRQRRRGGAVRGHGRRAAPQRHPDRAHFDDRAALKPQVRTRTGTLEVRGRAAQPARRRRRRPLGVLCVFTGVAGSGKSSLSPARSPGATAWCRSTRAPSRAPRRSNPRRTRAARADPQGIRRRPTG